MGTYNVLPEAEVTIPKEESRARAEQRVAPVGKPAD